MLLLVRCLAQCPRAVGKPLCEVYGVGRRRIRAVERWNYTVGMGRRGLHDLNVGVGRRWCSHVQPSAGMFFCITSWGSLMEGGTPGVMLKVAWAVFPWQ